MYKNDFLSANHGTIVSLLDSQVTNKEFELHEVLHKYGLVPSLTEFY